MNGEAVRPHDRWCALVAEIEAAGSAIHLRWINWSIRHTLGLDHDEGPATVRWTLCLERRSPDTLASEYLDTFQGFADKAVARNSACHTSTERTPDAYQGVHGL